MLLAVNVKNIAERWSQVYIRRVFDCEEICEYLQKHVETINLIITELSDSLYNIFLCAVLN